MLIVGCLAVGGGLCVCGGGLCARRWTYGVIMGGGLRASMGRGDSRRVWEFLGWIGGSRACVGGGGVCVLACVCRDGAVCVAAVGGGVGGWVRGGGTWACVCVWVVG